jgi:hypothetical protein
MEVRWWVPAVGDRLLGSTALPSNSLGCIPMTNVKSVDVQMPVGMTVSMVSEYDGGPMDPWHIHAPPLNQTDIDGWCTKPWGGDPTDQ